MKQTVKFRKKEDALNENALTEEDYQKFLKAQTYEEQVKLLHLHSAKNQKLIERRKKSSPGNDNN